MEAAKKKELLRALKFFLFSCSAGVIEVIFDVLIFTNIFNAVAPDATWTKSVSYLIGLVASVIWNFTFNRKFTFKAANNVPKAMGLAFLFYVFFTPLAEFFTAFLSTGDILGIIDITKWGITPVGLDQAGMLGDFGGFLITFIVMFCNMALEFPWQKFVVFRNSIDQTETVKKDEESNKEEEPKEEDVK